MSKETELGENQRVGMSLRLGISAELSLRFTNNIGKIGFLPESLSRLKELRSPAILATTHLSDWDVTAVVYSLFKFTDIRAKIVAASTHESFKQNPTAWMGQVVAGAENFIPIGVTGDVREEGIFRIADFKKMEETLVGGSSILIAAYHDRRFVGYNQHNTSLPPKPGVGAAFLSMRTGFPIIPISVNVGENKGRVFERPGIEISVGQSIEPLHTNTTSWEDLERKQKIELLKECRSVGKNIMLSLASMLPEEKRGVWGNNI